METLSKSNLTKINNWLWEIPKSYRSDMRVPARVFASEKLLDDILGDRSLAQLINVATLPGIFEGALAMPDAHEGYGFPVGGVAAFDLQKGIISPGGIGYDINCGVRLLHSSLKEADVRPHLERLGHTLMENVPSGLGVGGELKIDETELDKYLKGGAEYAVRKGYGSKDDLANLEANGRLEEADPAVVSASAKARGRDQLGTLGSGNHFLEVDVVEQIFDIEAAQNMGIFENLVTVTVHTGSRGLGHQVATDYIRLMMKAMAKYNISVPDRELACAPFSSEEGRNYFAAMSAAANFAWANRQIIFSHVQESWQAVFGAANRLETVYDVAHNIAKIEEFHLNGQKVPLVVHRKGATRSYPNQPVLIPGSMGTNSYVLVGQSESLNLSFGSTCHGAGRRMSRVESKRKVDAPSLKKHLEQMGIAIFIKSFAELAEEAPQAYKDVNEVVEVVHQVGLAKKVARLRPMAVIKG